MADWWKKLLGVKGSERGEEAPEPANDGPERALEDISCSVEQDVDAGFYAREEIVARAADYVADVLSEAEARAEAERILEPIWSARLREQQGWDAVTDCDRLDAAFTELERGGIVMRQNFTCCGTCGSSEIWGEIKAYEAAGRQAFGYGFYHSQDTESAAEGYGICLDYGACAEGEEPALATARAIVAALEKQGLKTSWDGSWDRRVEVALDWKRRLPA